MNIGIVGAGVTGLTAAYDLLKMGHSVTVYEARPYVGGLAAGFKDPAWEWPLERFYHHIFASDKDIIGLLNELGIGDRLYFPSSITSIYYKGEIYPMTREQGGLMGIVLQVLSFKPLSFFNRLRFGAVSAYIRYTPFWKSLERVTAHEWLQKMVGKQAYEVSWQPLLEGKFGPYYKQVNMAWFWARLAARTPQLGYFEGGFQGILDSLADKVRIMGGEIRLETHVRGIHPEGGTAGDRAQTGIRLELGTGNVVHDRVLATCSPEMLKERTPALPASYTAGLDKLKSMGAVVLVLAVKQSVTGGHYWINIPKREGFPFLAFVEHTNYVDKQHYGGDTIIFCGDYLPQGHAYFDMSPEEILDAFLPGIQRLNPAFDRSWIRNYWKFSEIYAQPVPFVNHSTNIPPLQTPIPNLYMANMSQVYPWDRGSNYAVEMGRRVARLMGR
ncbi:MAG: NAD(P)/FAD-dependent oxidoreductase [Anaerolineae bacterium]|nr:NAD(P)/FAD-dependent oxidoreductase [Anaerolineae bacterium]